MDKCGLGIGFKDWFFPPHSVWFGSRQVAQLCLSSPEVAIVSQRVLWGATMYQREYRLSYCLGLECVCVWNLASWSIKFLTCETVRILCATLLATLSSGDTVVQDPLPPLTSSSIERVLMIVVLVLMVMLMLLLLLLLLVLKVLGMLLVMQLAWMLLVMMWIASVLF